MYIEIKNYCDKCDKCNKRKLPNAIARAPLNPLPLVSYPFERVAVDFMGPLTMTNSGNKYIIVFTDYLTRYIEAFATPNQTTETVAQLLLIKNIARHSAPKELLSEHDHCIHDRDNKITV